MALTDVAVRTAKPKEKAYKLFDERGLFLLVAPSGGKLWRFKFRFTGKEKLLALGAYPDVSLAQARERREDARKLLAQGIDPSDAKKEAKAEIQAQSDTFKILAREWHEKQLKVWSAEHASKIMSRLEKHIFPSVGNTPITELRAPDILPALRAIESQGHHETAKRLRQYCEAVFAFAIATGRAERNIGADLRGALAPCRVKNRPAIVDPQGVAGLLRAIDGYQGSAVTLTALRLLPLVFTRPGELRQAEWSEINLDDPAGPIWSIPASKMKMKRDHLVPLSRQAVQIIEDLFPLTGNGRYLFPCNRTKGRCMSNMTLNGALRRLGFAQDEMCAHGFRSTASSLLHELGWASDLIEKQLAHTIGGVRGVYCRAEFLADRRRMMQAWADYLDGLKEHGKVIPLRHADGMA